MEVGSELQIIGCSSTLVGVYTMSHEVGTLHELRCVAWGRYPDVRCNEFMMDSHTCLAWGQRMARSITLFRLDPPKQASVSYLSSSPTLDVER